MLISRDNPRHTISYRPSGKKYDDSDLTLDRFASVNRLWESLEYLIISSESLSDSLLNFIAFRYQVSAVGTGINGTEQVTVYSKCSTDCIVLV